MSEIMVVPWYATSFRADEFGAALNEIAAVAMRYGASAYEVYRSADDRYRFQQFTTFDDHLAWERYWEGPEMIEFRALHSSAYQVPVLYGAWQRTAGASIEAAAAARRDAQSASSEQDDGSQDAPAGGRAAQAV